MKRIVNGVTYNTATSTRLAESRWERDHDETVFGVLYQTRGGAYFVDEEITRQEWNESERATETKVRHSFEPRSPEDAHKWMLEGEVEIFHNPFDDPPEATAEAEPGATIYIRVPASLKQRVDEAARQNKLSGNVWAMRCVERCLEPSLDAKEEIALAYAILAKIGAYTNDGGHSPSQIRGLCKEAQELIHTAWGDLGFDDSSKGGDIGTRIYMHADQLSLERLERDYPPYA